MGRFLRLTFPLLFVTLLLLLPGIAKAQPHVNKLKKTSILHKVKTPHHKTPKQPVLDFGCGQFGGFNCTGIVNNIGGGKFSGSGIKVYNSTYPGDAFIISFNTKTGKIALTDEDTHYSGTIVPGGVHDFFGQDLLLSVNWKGGIGPQPGNFITIDSFAAKGSTSKVFNASVLTNGSSSVPEPASLLLLGSGLVGFAGFLRRRFAR